MRVLFLELWWSCKESVVLLRVCMLSVCERLEFYQWRVFFFFLAALIRRPYIVKRVVQRKWSESAQSTV